jgi:hypothetical protein
VREIRVGAEFLRGRLRFPSVLQGLEGEFAWVVDASLQHYHETGETPLTLFSAPCDEPDSTRHGESLCRAGTGQCLALDPSGEASICPVLVSGEFPASAPLSSRRAGLLLGSFGAPDFRARLQSVPQAIAAAGIFGWEHKHSRFGPCAECEAADVCRPCPVSILFDAENDDPDRIPDFQCVFSRVAARHRSRFLEQRGPRFSEGFAKMLRSLGLTGTLPASLRDPEVVGA